MAIGCRIKTQPRRTVSMFETCRDAVAVAAGMDSLLTFEAFQGWRVGVMMPTGGVTFPGGSCLIQCPACCIGSTHISRLGGVFSQPRV